MVTTSEEHEEDSVEEERGDRGREGRHGGAEGGESLLGEVRGGVGAEDNSKVRLGGRPRGRRRRWPLKRETTRSRSCSRRRRVLVADAVRGGSPAMVVRMRRTARPRQWHHTALLSAALVPR
uniref:Uncharacterized protein n=1 Tax=Oryza barthii TaxID=65489 RepID=A0A0D3GK32_9ORYZ